MGEIGGGGCLTVFFFKVGTDPKSAGAFGSKCWQEIQRVNGTLQFFFCFWTSCLEIHPYLHNGCHEILKYPDSAVREVSMFKSFESFIYVCLSIFTTYSERWTMKNKNVFILKHNWISSITCLHKAQMYVSFFWWFEVAVLKEDKGRKLKAYKGKIMVRHLT